MAFTNLIIQPSVLKRLGRLTWIPALLAVCGGWAFAPSANAGFFLGARGGLALVSGDSSNGYDSKSFLLGGEAGIGFLDTLEIGGFYDSYSLSVDTSSVLSSVVSSTSVKSYGALARVYLPLVGVYAEGRLGRGGGFGLGYRATLIPMVLDLKPHVTYVSVTGNNFLTFGLLLSLNIL